MFSVVLRHGKYQTPSKYCDEHSECSANNSATPPVSKSDTEIELPDNADDTLLVGYKKSSNLRFYDRTTGILIVDNFTEMYTCESPTQAYISTFGRSFHDLSRIIYLGYDRTCDLHPFLKNIHRKGSTGAKILLDNVKFMVDLWHCNKHKELTCMPPDNPACIYHPKLPNFSEVDGVNTECAKQAFKWLGRYKHLTRRMTKSRFSFFVWKVIDIHNKRVERELQLKKLM